VDAGDGQFEGLGEVGWCLNRLAEIWASAQCGINGLEQFRTKALGEAGAWQPEQIF